VAAIAAQIEALETLKEELKGILSGWQNVTLKDRHQRTICPNIQSK